MPKGPSVKDRFGQKAGLDDPGQDEGIGPQRSAGENAGNGAVRVGASPKEAAEKCRRELGDGDKGDKPDRGQSLAVAQRQVNTMAHGEHQEDHNPTDVQEQACHVLEHFVSPGARAQNGGDDDAVADHDGEGDRFDDDHGRGCRQAADVGQDGNEAGVELHRNGKDENVGLREGGRDQDDARSSNRHDEKVDQEQVQRQQPAGAADLVFRAVLDDRDVELARQDDDADRAQQRDHQPGTRSIDGREAFHDLIVERNGGHESDHVTEGIEDDEDANAEKGDELDQAFGRNRHHEAVLVLGRVDVAGAEEDGECGHREGRDEGRVDDADAGQLHGYQRVAAKKGLGCKDDGLQLQGDIGQQANQRDDRDDGGNGGALAVAGREEVGDRGDVLGFGETDDAGQKLPAKQEDEGGADVDGEEVPARGAGAADAAKERPGRAINRDRERIDKGAAKGRAPAIASPAVASPCDREQHTDVGDGEDDDEGCVKHAVRPSRKRSTPIAPEAYGRGVKATSSTKPLGKAKFLGIMIEARARAGEQAGDQAPGQTFRPQSVWRRRHISSRMAISARIRSISRQVRRNKSESRR